MLHKDAQSLLKNEFSCKTILFVEDNTRNATFFVLPISPQIPDAILIVTNRQETLQILRDIVPDLIILCDHVPKFDGLSYYEQLRLTQGQEETPVIFLSPGTPLNSVSKIGHHEVVLVEKPVELNDLLVVAQYALARD